MNGYFRTIYLRGALGFAALRQEVGFRAFFAGLRDYATRFRFAVATPDDLRAAFERAARRDLTAFWRETFETGGRPRAIATPGPGTPPAAVENQAAAPADDPAGGRGRWTQPIAFGVRAKAPPWISQRTRTCQVSYSSYSTAGART